MPRNLPKILLAIAAITAFTFSAFFLRQKSSSVTLTARDNQFLLSFDLTKRDEQEIVQFLTKLGLPKETVPSFSFKIDATSSARLAFSLPIDADLKVDSKEISFTGKHNSPQMSVSTFDPLNLPKDINLAIFSPQIPYLFKSNLNFPSEFANWFFAQIDESKPVVIAAFADDASWLLVFQWKTPPDFEELSNLNKRDLEDSYKKEDSEERTTHLIKLKVGEEEKILALYDEGNQAYLTSTKEVAKRVQDAHNAQDNLFPQSTQDVVFELLYKTPENAPFPKDLAALIADFPNAPTQLKEIDQARFLLKPQSFSGLIKLK